jgi:hypothetical protein
MNHFEQLSAKDEELIQKLDEFMLLLQNSELNSENIKGIQNKLNTALDHKLSNTELVHKIKEVSLSEIGKLDQLDQLETLLNTNYLDSKQLRKEKIKQGLSTAVMLMIGLLFITMGIAMIIIPAPPYFEMFTIFYFSVDDGVTLMDLIALIITAIGTFIVIKSLLTKRKND